MTDKWIISMSRKFKDNLTPRNAKISIRVTKATRDRLESAAANNGRLMTDEIETRLLLSLEADDAALVRHFGHESTYALLRLAAEAIKQVEALAGVRWYQSRFVHEAAVEAAAKVLHAFRPKGRTVAPSTFPVMAALDAYPDNRRAVRLGLAKKPWGAVVARTCIALMQAAEDNKSAFADPYGKIAAKLGKRITRPVL